MICKNHWSVNTINKRRKNMDKEHLKESINVYNTKVEEEKKKAEEKKQLAELEHENAKNQMIEKIGFEKALSNAQSELLQKINNLDDAALQSAIENFFQQNQDHITDDTISISVDIYGPELELEIEQYEDYEYWEELYDCGGEEDQSLDDFIESGIEADAVAMSRNVKLSVDDCFQVNFNNAKIAQSNVIYEYINDFQYLTDHCYGLYENKKEYYLEKEILNDLIGGTFHKRQDDYITGDPYREYNKSFRSDYNNDSEFNTKIIEAFLERLKRFELEVTDYKFDNDNKDEITVIFKNPLLEN
jgi:hypothetical protein